MISSSRRDSVGGGGIVAQCLPHLLKPTIFGGRRVVAGIFRDLQKRNQMFTPHCVIFMGIDTRLGEHDKKIRISCGKIIDQSNSLNSGRFVYNSVRPGDHAPFL